MKNGGFRLREYENNGKKKDLVDEISGRKMGMTPPGAKKCPGD